MKFYSYLAAVLLVIPKTEAQNRCSQELEPGSECVLSKCREECLKKLKGFGTCIEKPAGSHKYTCNCLYNCGAQ